MVVISLFAFQLHLDNNTIMGNNRKVLGFIGFCCLISFVLGSLSEKIREWGLISFLNKINFNLTRFFRGLNQFPGIKELNGFVKLIRKSRLLIKAGQYSSVWTAVVSIFCLLIYSWYITSGKWVWFPYTHYFDLLADAFLKGSLSLLEKPSSTLIALANPYGYLNREGISYLWDSSLYQGRYFLYWGPVPALFAAFVKSIRAMVVEDQYLVLISMAGLAFVLAALLHWLRSVFYPKTPGWTVPFLILIGMLSLPMLWIINRPSVYEVAISAGVFFLMLGIYTSLRGLAANRKNIWLVITGLAWGAALGCRVNQATVVIWLTSITVLYLIIRNRKGKAWILPVILLILPLLTWAGGLGWYNYARFGNILETGHRFQLTGPALPSDYKDIVSVYYVIPNLFNYLFRPLVYNWGNFPFVNAPYLSDKMWPWFIFRPPYFYSTEPVTGIFRAVPIFWLVLLLILKPLQNFWGWANELPAKKIRPANSLYPWVWLMFSGAILISLGSLSIFLASNMRYLVDIIPLLTVLTGFCIWWGLDFLKPWPILYNILIAIIVILGVMGILIGLLASFNTGLDRFALNNPHLYRSLVLIFSSNR